MYQKTRYLLVGDSGISVEFGNDLDKETNLLVHKMKYVLDKTKLEGVIESIPTIRSLFVYYDPRIVKENSLVTEIKLLEKEMTDVALPKSNLFEIPIVYGGEYGPDFDYIAQLLNLTTDELIKIHSGKEYFVLQTGFIGGSAHFKIPHPLDSLPRKKTPNLGVPAGSVLVAGGLGSVFKPLAGPTGWYWIGMSPLRQWFPEKDPPLLINPGDKIIYKPINIRNFKKIKKLVEKGCYQIKNLESEKEGFHDD